MSQRKSIRVTPDRSTVLSIVKIIKTMEHVIHSTLKVSGQDAVLTTPVRQKSEAMNKLSHGVSLV